MERKEAIEIVTKLYNESLFLKKDKDAMVTLIPELKESEDEKIRKAIIEHFTGLHSSMYPYKGFTKEQILSWFERQGEKTSDKIAERARTEKQRVLLTETDGVANIDWDTRSLQDVKLLLEYGLDYIKKKEKQGEQKPANKVKPKFKVDDWVVNKFGNVWHIDSINKKNYQVSNGNEYNYFPISKQDEMHLWSIEDAKDGDVLAAHECLVIFKEIEGLNIRCYCTYHTMYNTTFYTNTLQNKTAFYPATKKQCDSLMKAMTAEGYTFDFEKKELKKSDNEPVDKVKPKFKVGDWVIDKQRIVHQIARVIENVTNHTFAYDIVGGGYFGDNTEGVRLWTIQDGDVLTTDTWTFIFKKYQDKSIYYHCAVSTFNEFSISDTGNFDSNYVHPATKEQCDALFAKIRNEGYEWDAEKKELKKVKPKFHEGDIIKPKDGGHEPWQIMQIDISDKKYRFADGYVIHFSQEDDYELVEQKPAWSEDDDQYLLVCKNALEKYQTTDKWDARIISRWLEDKLKFIRLQPTWFPSDEQMDALHDAAVYVDKSMFPYPKGILMKLYKQLKKLRNE